MTFTSEISACNSVIPDLSWEKTHEVIYYQNLEATNLMCEITSPKSKLLVSIPWPQKLVEKYILCVKHTKYFKKINRKLIFVFEPDLI